ncbi:MAG: LacI family DNA-binding transcriptional regulator [Chloroflexi bacterium]|nr:LacI family DNA-binding transcriptional regulator [Chloroflexota bacterium]
MSIRVTLKQVAAEAGVSFQTVSKVINGNSKVAPETEGRIWRAVRALGYQPDALARNLKSRRSRMLAYSWAPLPPDQPNPILDQFLRSMMQAATRAGYHILPFPHPDEGHNLSPYRDLGHSGRVDGFIISSIKYDDPRIAFLQEQGFPFVAFGRSNPGCEFPFVDVDGAAGLRLATEHLLLRGHRRIAALAWPEESRVGQNRIEGYFEALRAAGLGVREDWIARGEGRVAFGHAATRRWLDGPNRPTALVALNDLMAIGALRAAQERGLRVPDDLAITGFDDVPMAQYLTPPLTTIRQPIWEVGQQVIAILIGILEGSPPTNAHELLQPELVVRASS